MVVNPALARTHWISARSTGTGQLAGLARRFGWRDMTPNLSHLRGDWTA